MIKKISFISIILIVVSILKYLDSNSFPLKIDNIDKNWVYAIDWIYIIFFVIILYFFFTYSKWEEKTRKDNLNGIVAYCCLNAFLAYSLAGGVSNRKTRERDKYRNCWNNIRVINNAIENYNMDSSEMMTTEIDFNKLIEGKYLKSIPEGSEKSCCYKAYHDLTEDGFVYCVKHKYSNLGVFQKNLVSLTDLNLDKELKNRPDLFSDEEKEFLLKSNKEIDKSTDLRDTNDDLTLNKYRILILSLPLIFLFFPSIAFRK